MNFWSIVKSTNLNFQILTVWCQHFGVWRRHFGTLATPEYHPDFDEEYGQLVASEILAIMDICSSVPARDSGANTCITDQKVKEAIESMTKGKAVGFQGVTVEHFLWPCSITESDRYHQQCISLW